LPLPGKEIARLLDLSPRTVEIHRATLLKRLGVHPTLEAVTVGALAGFGACEFMD
jgi:DNA-binding NarL/FixJ family response regulator